MGSGYPVQRNFRRRPWQRSKAAWRFLNAADLPAVLVSAGARERSKSVYARTLHRRTRLEAASMYRRRFGEAAFLEKYGGPRMLPPRRMWLPGGYAWWKARSWKGNGAV